MTWHDQAKCGRVDPSPWTNFDAKPHCSDNQSRARELCSGCPVIAECAVEAIRHSDEGVVRAGVWIAPTPKLLGDARLEFAARYGRPPWSGAETRAFVESGVHIRRRPRLRVGVDHVFEQRKQEARLAYIHGRATMADLAERCGVTAETIRHWVRGAA